MEQKIASSAMQLMASHQVPPTPENYTLWYHYVTAKNAELNAEIDKMMVQKVPFSTRLNASIYQRFFMVEREQKVVGETAQTAQKMLADVIKAVNSFSGEAKDYNEGLGGYVETLSKDYGSPELIQELLSATLHLKQTGEQMQERLETSRTEIDSLRKSLQEVTNESQKDGLTGLLNRKTFEKLLEEQFEVAQEKKHDLCLLMLDVDHFKKFNDTYGHLLGDEVLKIVSRTLTDTLKGRDVVARFGGEEFMVFLPETPIEGAMRVADAVRQSIASKELKRKDTGENFGRVTVSIGVSRYRHGVDDVAALIKRADEALYDSKRGGRNKVTREA